MDSPIKTMNNIEFLKTIDYRDYVEDQIIGVGGGTVTDVPKTPNVVIQVIIEGKRYDLIAYEAKS